MQRLSNPRQKLAPCASAADDTFLGTVHRRFSALARHETQ